VKVVGNHSYSRDGLNGWGKKYDGRSDILSLISCVIEYPVNRCGTAKAGMYIFNYSVWRNWRNSP